MMSLPRVSVIVAMKNSETTIGECLNSLLLLDYPDYEIIMVDDGSSDKTPEIVKCISPDRVKVITSTGKGPSVARNIGVEKSSGEIVAFTDSDCTVDKLWLSELVRGLQIFPEASSVGGKQKIPASATGFEKKVYEFMLSVGFITDYMHSGVSEKIMMVDHNPSCCSAYRRDAFLRAGGFPENLWPGEDVELDYKISQNGEKILWNPAAIVFHHRPGTPAAFSRMMHRYGRAQGILVRKHGLKRKIQYLPVVTLLSLLCMILLNRNNLSRFIYSAFALMICSTSFFSFDFFIWRLAVIAFISWQIGFLQGLKGKIS